MRRGFTGPRWGLPSVQHTRRHSVRRPSPSHDEVTGEKSRTSLRPLASRSLSTTQCCTEDTTRIAKRHLERIAIHWFTGSGVRAYTPPSPSLGEPLLSPSESPPLPCGMPLFIAGAAVATGAGGATTGGGGATVGGGGTGVRGGVVVGAGREVAVGRGRGVAVERGRSVLLGRAVGFGVAVGATEAEVDLA